MTPTTLLEEPETAASVSAATSRPSAAGGSSGRSLPRLGRSTQGATRSWATIAVMALFHAGAIAALFFFSWGALATAAILWIFAVNAGIGMGYHRLLTHRGYRTPRWVEYALAVCGTLALEGGPLFWVGTHRLHHQLSDQEGDPHTPHDGTLWAHVGWILCGVPLHAETALLAHYAPDLARDRFHVWLSRYHWVPLAVSGLLLAALGGWSYLLWGLFLRVTLGLHATWLVNSASHTSGSRRFATRDDSRNNWWVALLTGGEGWHNNHHAHPVSARHGLVWWELDPNYYGIWLLSRLGLASNIKRAAWDAARPRPAGGA